MLGYGHQPGSGLEEWLSGTMRAAATDNVVRSDGLGRAGTAHLWPSTWSRTRQRAADPAAAKLADRRVATVAAAFALLQTQPALIEQTTPSPDNYDLRKEEDVVRCVHDVVQEGVSGERDAGGHELLYCRLFSPVVMEVPPVDP